MRLPPHRLLAQLQLWMPLALGRLQQGAAMMVVAGVVYVTCAAAAAAVYLPPKPPPGPLPKSPLLTTTLPVDIPYR